MEPYYYTCVTIRCLLCWSTSVTDSSRVPPSHTHTHIHTTYKSFRNSRFVFWQSGPRGERKSAHSGLHSPKIYYTNSTSSWRMFWHQTMKKVPERWNKVCTVQPKPLNKYGVLCNGVLAQAKNLDKLFWEEKFHAANGKAQACTQGGLLFFPLSLGGKDFFFIFPWFPTCSCYVPFKFPMGSHQVLNMFPSSQWVPRHVLHSFYLNILWQMLSSCHLYRWAKGEEFYTSN